jgi:nitrite reductase/ring-hydroxylating ferredoxin subunit
MPNAESMIHVIRWTLSAALMLVASSFLCPWHGAKFSAEGRWIGGHDAKDLRALAVVVDDKTGVITISG